MRSPDRTDGQPFRVTARIVQCALGVVWLLDGILQLQPKMFGQSFITGVLDPAAQGQPTFIAWPLTHMDHLVATSPAAFNAVFAAVQLLIGIGLLRRETVKPALVLSFAWSLGVSALGEGFGMIFTGQASPLTGAPGAVPLYAVVGLLVWPQHDDAGRPGSTAAAAADGPIGRSGARVMWAVLWIGMGVLWLLPANRGSNGVSEALMSAASGEPGWLANLQTATAHTFSGDGMGIALVLALVSCWIGLGPTVSRRPILFLVVGATLSFDFWVLGQSFGGMLTGLGTDPNAGPLFILLALTIFPNTASVQAGSYAGTERMVPDAPVQWHVPSV